MAVIRIFIEGGIVPHVNDAAQTVNNSQRLREAFYKLLTQELGGFDFRLEVEMSGGWRQTLNRWKRSNSEKATLFVLIDSARPPDLISERITELQIPPESVNRVFFMVQEMEAWMLSQPERIVEVFRENLKSSETNFLEAVRSKGAPRRIAVPSDQLRYLLGRHVRVEKNGRMRKKKYNKLTDGAAFLEKLSSVQLQKDFPYYCSLITTLKTP